MKTVPIEHNGKRFQAELKRISHKQHTHRLSLYEVGGKHECRGEYVNATEPFMKGVKRLLNSI